MEGSRSQRPGGASRVESTPPAMLVQNPSRSVEPGKTPPNPTIATASSCPMLTTALSRSARGDFSEAQAVASERLVERGVDHALVGFDPGHRVALGVVEFDIGHGPMVGEPLHD